MNRRTKFVLTQLLSICIIVALFGIIVTANKRYKAKISDVRNVSSLQTYHLVSKYDPNIVETIEVSSITELLEVAETNPVKFDGTMTAYGPDCVGCSGIVSCPPNPNVKKTTTYEDKEYGKIRIVAADKRIPCGTIVNVTGSKEADEFTAIVLDRGGVIKNTLMDLLYPSEEKSSSFGRQKVTYEIVRWGW